MKKKWNERTEADKRRIENWAKARQLKRQEFIQKIRLRKINREMGTYLRDEVETIHSVCDTPRSLTIAFIKWQEKHGKQR